MKKLLTLALLSTLLFSCAPNTDTSVKTQQSDIAQKAANSITFAGNAEIDNIKRRLQITSNPAQVGYVLLLNQSGQPISYYVIKGKVTSSGKRLTQPDFMDCWSSGCNIRIAPGDEGTYGSSDSYVYFWTTDGRYVQWSGQYLYSTQPVRIRIEPLVISDKQAL